MNKETAGLRGDTASAGQSQGSLLPEEGGRPVFRTLAVLVASYMPFLSSDAVPGLPGLLFMAQG